MTVKKVTPTGPDPAAWFRTLTRDGRITDPRVKLGGLVIGGQGYWPSWFARIDARLVCQITGLDLLDLDFIIEKLIEYGYLRRHESPTTSRTEVFFEVPEGLQMMPSANDRKSVTGQSVAA